MSWTYKTSTGELFNSNNTRVGAGYAGHGEGLNNPAMAGVSNVGPLPTGLYHIGTPIDDPNSVGVFAMPLTQLRSGFFIHGDNPFFNHTASDGCVVLNLVLRGEIANSADDTLIVIP